MLSKVLIVLLVLSLALAARGQDKTAADQSEQLFAAARKGDIEAVKALLAKGVDVNAKTRYGVTALFYA
ncbi:MAG TPA: ankyrin repeat domain-containing protein, partial [Blastocatellia bacterium]|nr:ankyrin repeat domain-containing protein [Blastocatellia bacterium]